MAEEESPNPGSDNAPAQPAGADGNTVPLIGQIRARWDALDTKARTAIVLVVAAVLVVGIGTIIGEVADFDEVLRAIREASPAWLAVCLAGEVLAYVGYILAFWGTSRAARGPEIRLGVMTHGVFVAFGAFAAANAAGGLATDFWMLREAGSTTRAAVRRVLALNALLYAVFGLGAFVASMLVVTDVTDVPLGLAIPWLVIVPPCVALGIWLSGSATGRRLAGQSMKRTWSRLFGDAVASVILCRWIVRTPWLAQGGTGRPHSELGGRAHLPLGCAACVRGPDPAAAPDARVRGRIRRHALAPSGWWSRRDRRVPRVRPARGRRRGSHRRCSRPLPTGSSVTGSRSHRRSWQSPASLGSDAVWPMHAPRTRPALDQTLERMLVERVSPA